MTTEDGEEFYCLLLSCFHMVPEAELLPRSNDHRKVGRPAQKRRCVACAVQVRRVQPAVTPGEVVP